MSQAAGVPVGWFMTRLLALALVPFLSARGALAPLDEKASSITFTGHATLHDFHGEVRDFHGQAMLTRGAPFLVTTAEIDFATAGLTTFQSARDRNMAEWLKAASNPTIVYRLEKITCRKGDPAHASPAQPAEFVVRGTLTLNQMTRPVLAVVQGWRDRNELVVTGTANLNTLTYGLPIIKQFFLTVDEHVDVAFRLVFDLPPSASGAVQLRLNH